MKDQDIMQEEIHEEKLIAQKIPEEIYWEYKSVAALRRENAKQSLLSAILLYIAAGDKKGQE